MNWGFLSQFWDLIVSVGEYPIEFFQNIGIAVAGAIGGFFDAIFHNLNDIFVIAIWLGIELKTIFLAIISPVIYFFNVVRWFFSLAFQTPTEAGISYTFTGEVLEVFNAIPHWSTISLVLGAIVLTLGGVAMLKLLLKT